MDEVTMVLTARRLLTSQRSPRRYKTRRYCQDAGCGARLNTYHRGDFCYLHAPLRFPRVRGVKPA